MPGYARKKSLTAHGRSDRGRHRDPSALDGGQGARRGDGRLQVAQGLASERVRSGPRRAERGALEVDEEPVEHSAARLDAFQEGLQHCRMPVQP